MSHHLKHHGLWDIVCGDIPQPSVLTSEGCRNSNSSEGDRITWDTRSAEAKERICSRLDVHIIPIVSANMTAPQLWADITRRYGQLSVSMLHGIFHNLCSVKYQRPFEEHLATFNHRWSELRVLTTSALPPMMGGNNSFETAMYIVATSLESKTYFLLHSMPTDITFRIRYGLTYDDVCDRLSDVCNAFER